MSYKRSYAIYCKEEERGYISGTFHHRQAKYVHLTELYADQYPDDEIPAQVLQIASIKTFPSKEQAQKSVEKYAPCANVTDIKNLIVKELIYKEIDLIARCRKFMEDRKKAHLHAEGFKDKKLKCSTCGNTKISEMVVSEKTYQLMDERKTSRVDERFPTKINVYCNRCTTKIV